MSYKDIVNIKDKKNIWEKIEVASILVVYPKRFLRFLVNLYMEAYVFFSLKPSPSQGESFLKISAH